MLKTPYLEEVISSKTWACDPPGDEAITDRDTPPTADHKEVHHGVPKSPAQPLGQSNCQEKQDNPRNCLNLLKVFLKLTYFYIYSTN